MATPVNLVYNVLAKISAGNRDFSDQLSSVIHDLPMDLQQEIMAGILKCDSNVDLHTLIPPAPSQDDGWSVQTLADANKPRPPISYAVAGLFAFPSINIIYGAPGDLKSMVLADCSVCIASGIPWLPPHPGSPDVVPFETIQANTLWIDYDNGTNTTADRFSALARARKLPDETPLYYVSMGSPQLDLSKTDTVKYLESIILERNIKVCCIDNLSIVAGVRDENSSEIGKSMHALRELADKYGIAFALIHHQRKSNGQGGRRGDTLRGHSSIESHLELLLQVERSEGSSSITIRAPKVRGAPVNPFGATFVYEHKPGTHDLNKAQFFGSKPDEKSEQDTGDKRDLRLPHGDARELIEEIVKSSPDINQKTLVAEVKNRYPKASHKQVVKIIDEMMDENILTSKVGARNSNLYNLNR